MSRSNSAPRTKGENQDLTELLTASEDKPKDDGDEQSGFKSHASLLLRIALFAAACIFAILGVITLVNTNKTQVAAQQVAQQSVQAEPVAHVLVLVSYDQGDPDTAFEVKGVSDMLGRSSISSDIFYLDARTASQDTKLLDLTEQQIVQKVETSGGYDGIVCAGDEALTFVTERQDLFADLPTVFFAVDDQAQAADAQEAGLATGLWEQGSAELTLQTAAGLVPDASRVVILTDGSPEAEGQLAQLKKSGAADGVERDVWDVSEMSRDKLGKKLSKLDEGAFVLLLAANHDSQGKVYSPSVTAHFVDDNASVPVFAAEGGFGNGVCGAAFTNRQEQGGDAVKMLVDLLNGKSVSQVKTKAVEPECMAFDVQALEAVGINPDSAPENSALTNEPALSPRVIRPMVKPIILLILAGVCILLFGVIGFRRSMRSNQAIIESRNDLQYRLYHDILTELPNRHALEKIAADPKNDAKVQSLVQLDIEGFSDINDSYGHPFGNEVIKVVAQRLSNVQSSLLVRAGGDEFILVFDHALTLDGQELRHIRRIFSDPVVVGDSKVDISARLGVANREGDMTSEDLIVYSDLATHEAKATRARVPIFYNESMRAAMNKKLEITSYLKHAIADEGINVVWQPQVDTQSLELYGYEALCRLEGNRYYPNDFIPVAEMSGLVAPLDRVMTKKVIEQLGTWLREGRKDVGVASINFSAAQLRDKGYFDFLTKTLSENKVPASLIKIEITESMLLGNEEEADKLFSRLQHMGITLALDDFGTGYSSLSRMANIPVDFVKLDKSLVDTFMLPGREEFIKNVTELVHCLGKKIVVEGVETYEQYEICQQLGCDLIQGYFFSKPVAVEDLEAFDANKIVADAKAAMGDKTRNGDWPTYERDSRGRWQKKDKK